MLTGEIRDAVPVVLAGQLCVYGQVVSHQSMAFDKGDFITTSPIRAIHLNYVFTKNSCYKVTWR